MRIIILQIALMMCVLGATATGAQEKDPFFPAGPRSAVTGSVPSGAAWGRDPFSKPFETKPQIPTVGGIVDRLRGRTLTGIIYSRNVRLAIIGGETYKEGSKVGERKLVDIRRRSVVLRSDSGDYEELFLEDFSMRK